MYLPLSQLLAVGRLPDHKVAVRARNIITFAQFRADVGHNTARLRSVRCRAGAPVCGDSYWFLVGFFSLCHAGAAIVMPSNTQPDTLKALSSECDFLVVDEPTTIPGTFVLEAGTDGPWHPVPFDPNRIAVDFFTSGSAGSPKRVQRTVHLLEKEVRLVMEVLDTGSVDELVSGTVSHQHVYGLVFRLLWPLSCGRPFSATMHNVWEPLLAELQPGGVLITSPAHLSRLGGFDPIAPEHAPALIVSAGAPLPHEVAATSAAILRNYPTEIFGSTETGACAFRTTEACDRPWQPLPGVGFGLTPNYTLKVRSPAAALDAWVETADLIELLPGGGFRFKGRADRIAKIEGKRVSLPEVERQLSGLRWVDAAAALIVETAGTRLGAVVVVSRSGMKKLAELGEFRFGRMLRRELARTQDPAGVPRLWRFVEGLPVNDMGKYRERDLAALFTESRKR